MISSQIHRSKEPVIQISEMCSISCTTSVQFRKFANYSISVCDKRVEVKPDLVLNTNAANIGEQGSEYIGWVHKSVSNDILNDIQ